MVSAAMKCKAHYFAMDLPQSDDCFVALTGNNRREAFLVLSVL